MYLFQKKEGINMANLGGLESRTRQLAPTFEEVQDNMERKQQKMQKKEKKKKEKKEQKEREKKLVTNFKRYAVMKFFKRVGIGIALISAFNYVGKVHINNKANQEIDRIQNYDNNDYDNENDGYISEDDTNVYYEDGTQPDVGDYMDSIESFTEQTEVEAPALEMNAVSTISNLSQEEKDQISLDYMSAWKESIYNIADRPGFVTDQMREQIFQQYYPITDALLYNSMITMQDGNTFYLSDLSESAQSKMQMIYYTVDYRLDNMNSTAKSTYAQMRGITVDDINNVRDTFYGNLQNCVESAQFSVSDYHYQDFIKKGMQAVNSGKYFAIPMQNYIENLYTEMNSGTKQL